MQPDITLVLLSFTLIYTIEIFDLKVSLGNYNNLKTLRQ